MHARQSGFAAPRTLIVLLGLAGFTGMTLGGLYLAGDAGDQAVVSAGMNEPAAARAAIAVADGGHGDAVEMTAGAAGIEAATDTAPRDVSAHGLADGSMLPGGADSGVTDESPVSGSAAAAYDADSGADDAASAAEESSQASERVLHITNLGDRIVITESLSGTRVIPVSDAPTVATAEAYAPSPAVEPVPALAQVETTAVEPMLTSAPVPHVPTGGGVYRPQPPADVEEDAGAPPPRADYEDVYPGCPRVLPPGTGEEMANERLALYGCLYYSVCAMPTEDSPATCTWYLNQKI